MTKKEVALQAAKAASKIVKDDFGSVTEFSWKGNNKKDLVTETDFASEKVILSTIKKVFPYHGFYAEESGNDKIDAKSVWVIDPLDGTTNFTRQIPCVSISIALVENGKVQLGVIANPMTDEVFFAERGKGAFVNNQRIHVSHVRKLNESFVSAAWWSRNNNYVKHGRRIYNCLSEGARHIRNMSGTTWCLTRVAKGLFDVQTCDTQFHDIAAASIIIEEAGGLVTDSLGAPIVPFDASVKRIVAANPILHRKTLSLISRCA